MTTTPEPGTIEYLAELIRTQTQERLATEYERAQGEPMPADLHLTTVAIKPGPKYTKVDVGPECNRSGKYMVENATGVIFGIKGYGQVHKAHRYGTLATVDEWYWGGYTAVPKGQPGYWGSYSVVPKSERQKEPENVVMGDFTRTWTGVGAEFFADARLEEGKKPNRQRVERAIDGLKWQDAPEGDHSIELPMAPGLAIRQAIKELRLPKVSRFAISIDLAPFGFYGIEANYRNGRARVYIVDQGSVLTTLASDFWPAESGDKK